ncbi:MAG: hypothetical protein HY303_13215 [Candidatus Wallbacteria bacterium]|nr:hypothetical protein [Candidatus Wallbacteria bacterium]
MTASDYPEAPQPPAGAAELRGFVSGWLPVLMVSLTFLSRPMSAAGVPSVVNFLHFLVCPPMLLLLARWDRLPKDCRRLLGLSGLLFVEIVLSAALNGAGIINVVLLAVMLLEPFLLLAVFSAGIWTEQAISRFERVFFGCFALNLAMALGQWALLGLRNDEVTGLFLEMGAGAHLSGAFALLPAAFILARRDRGTKAMRVLPMALALGVIKACDSKQVLAAFILGMLLATLGQLGFTRIRPRVILAAILLVVSAQIALPVYSPMFRHVFSEDTMLLVLRLKLVGPAIIAREITNPLQYVFGIGPGHGFSRLAWLAPVYREYLEPLGLTESNVFDKVFFISDNFWLSSHAQGSSAFSPLHSYGATLGDLGWCGLALYLATWGLVWRMCADSWIERAVLATALVLGVTFMWLEEPPFILCVTGCLGMGWQRRRRKEPVRS